MPIRRSVQRHTTIIRLTWSGGDSKDQLDTTCTLDLGIDVKYRRNNRPTLETSLPPGLKNVG